MSHAWWWCVTRVQGDRKVIVSKHETEASAKQACKSGQSVEFLNTFQIGDCLEEVYGRVYDNRARS